MSNIILKNTSCPLIRTDVSQTELIQALTAAWFAVFQHPPTKRQIGIIWSHLALETGMSCSIFNYNLGNIQKMYGSGKHPYYTLPYDSSPLFLSFDSLLEGAKTYLFFLKEKKFSLSWQGIENENMIQFVSLLKEEKYFVSPYQEYLQAMMTYFELFMGKTDFEKIFVILNEKVMSRRSLWQRISNWLEFITLRFFSI